MRSQFNKTKGVTSFDLCFDKIWMLHWEQSVESGKGGSRKTCSEAIIVIQVRKDGDSVGSNAICDTCSEIGQRFANRLVEGVREKRSLAFYFSLLVNASHSFYLMQYK